MRGLSFKQKAVEAGAAENQIVVQGARKFSGGRARQRVLMTMAVFMGIYTVIGGRLALLAMEEPRASGPAIARQQAVVKVECSRHRPKSRERGVQG